MSDATWERAEAAMRAKRMELIAQPLDRIYGELLLVGFEILAEDLVKYFEAKADAAEATARSLRARANDPDDLLCPEDCIEIAEGWESDALDTGYFSQQIRARVNQMVPAKAAGIPVREG